ncbi:MAG: tetratricopeptide repeat protein [Clostridia bacterium]|nr:tetratricopeptide repeat protein [Clostridia bacterium]
MNNDPSQNGVIGPEDFAEPRCLLCDEPFGKEPEVRSVPQQRIIEKNDEYLAKKDYAGAERHLLYWLEEARLGNDKRGMLVIANELIGHYRKCGEKEKALANADLALSLIDELDLGDSMSAGTTYVNAATACNAFGENERSIVLFKKAEQAFKQLENVSSTLLGGLYNNMGLCCKALRRYGDALEAYAKADEYMSKVEFGELERAITCLNVADVVAADKGEVDGEPEIFELLDKAYDYLTKTAAPRDGYYAFVCEKCAPVFGHYGFFLASEYLEGEAERIYSGK